MNQKQIRAAVEAMLFASGDPIGADKLAQAVQLPQLSVEAALEALRERYAREDSGLCLLHLNTRWQLATKTEWADHPPPAGQPPRSAPWPRRHGDPDRDRLQPAGVPRLHRAGARRGFLVQRVGPAGKGPH